VSGNHSQPVQSVSDVISQVPAAAFSATLDRAEVPRYGADLPPMWHWFYFWTIVPQAELGSDGHPRKGGFLPDLSLPTSCWPDLTPLTHLETDLP